VRKKRIFPQTVRASQVDIYLRRHRPDAGRRRQVKAEPNPALAGRLRQEEEIRYRQLPGTALYEEI
jgi:hypothetical protein